MADHRDFIMIDHRKHREAESNTRAEQLALFVGSFVVSLLSALILWWAL